MTNQEKLREAIERIISLTIWDATHLYIKGKIKPEDKGYAEKATNQIMLILGGK